MATDSSSKPAVTIYEIAAHVGVSPAAVSSVLANRHVERRLAATTVEKVRAAALSLGYVPNMAGRRLRARGSSVRQFYLAILTSFEAPLPLVSQVLRKLQRAVDARATENTSYTVVIDMFHAGRLREKPGLLDSDRYRLARRARASMNDESLAQFLAAEPHLCPRCDSGMVHRTGPSGLFWGCSRFPMCRETIEDTAGS